MKILISGPSGLTLNLLFSFDRLRNITYTIVFRNSNGIYGANVMVLERLYIAPQIKIWASDSPD